MPDADEQVRLVLKEVYPFCNLSSAEFNLVCSKMQYYRFPENCPIFEEGQSADAFYFILSGKAEISISKKEHKKVIQQVDTFDHFGEDALSGSKRQSSAVACTPLIVVSLRTADAQKVMQTSPSLGQIFTLFEQSYRNLVKAEFEWRQPQETIYLLLRRHPFFIWSKLLPIWIVCLGLFGFFLFQSFTSPASGALWGFIAILALVMGGMFTFWEVLIWKNEFFILTKDRLINQKLVIGLFESQQITPMHAILSVEMTTNFLGRLIGYGLVRAKSYTGTFSANHIQSTAHVLEYIDYRRKLVQAEQKRVERAYMHSMLESRIHPEHTRAAIPAQPPAKPTVPLNYYGNSFSDFLARLFSLRLEKEEAVIYHTHWWILLKKLLLPSLLLIALVALVVTRILDLFTLNASFIYIVGIIGATAGWGWWIYQYIDWRNDVYIITADQLVDMNQKPLGTQDKRSAPIKNIQTVEYKRNGIIGMALNFGTVRIQIGNEELTFDDVYNPAAIQTEIFNRFREFNENSRLMEQKRIADWFTTYDGMRHENNENGDESQTGNG